MNKRQKKKKGLLSIVKKYSNWGSKKNKSIAPKVVEEVKVEETPKEEVVEETEEKELDEEAK